MLLIGDIHLSGSACVVWQVGDQSDFATAIGRALQEFGPQVGSALPEHHFAFLCDKVGTNCLGALNPWHYSDMPN